MNPTVAAILETSRKTGWVMEPLARDILRSAGLPVTRSVWARTDDEALAAVKETGYPVVVKVVSPEVVHKSDMGGVAVGVADDGALGEAFRRMADLPAFQGVLVDEMVKGIELIVGAKQDPQFGTIVMVGIGGTAVEIYQDVAIREAPLSTRKADEALRSLKGRALLEEFRGSRPVHRESLVSLLADFSILAHDLRAEVESIDLNPVFCNAEEARIADARMMLFPD
jgi:succinyl-CoA synthetase beta subunit